MLNIKELHRSESSFFCSDIINTGALLQVSEEHNMLLQKYTGRNLVGMSLNNVVNIDLTKSHLNFRENEVQQHSKINVLTQGVIVYKFNNRLKLPIHQPVYASVKGIDFRKYGPKIGFLTSNQDKDGYCTVYINFINP